jgi:hypothetical protein
MPEKLEDIIIIINLMVLCMIIFVLKPPELIEILIMIIIIVTITATITITITMLEIILVVGQYLLDIHVVLTIQQYIILMIMEIGEFKTITGVVFK